MWLSPSKDCTQVVAWPPLLLAIIGGIGASYLLMPNDQELKKRIERDRTGHSVSNILEANWTDTKKNVSRAIQELPKDRLAELLRLCHLTPHERLRSVLDEHHLASYDTFSQCLVRSSVRYIDVIAPKEAFTFIEPKLKRIPSQFALDLLGLLAQNALAAEQPSLAADITLRACANPDSKWADVKQMIVACQWSGRANEAVPVAKVWVKDHSRDLTSAQTEEARAMICDLCIAGNDPGQALDMCLEELRSLAANVQPAESLMERTFRAATFANRSDEIIPWMDRFLAAMPESRLSWQELLKLPRPATGSVQAYLKWLERSAQMADWNAKTEPAYQAYSRLLTLGRFDGIDRFLSLSSYTGQGEDTAELLRAIGPIPGHEDAQIFLARLVAANGQPVEARSMFERWIAAHPDDREARYELANLIRGVDSTEAAIAAFKDFLKAFPKDPSAIKRLADLRLRANQNEAALTLLDELKDSDLDPITLENYVTLAEAVERKSSLLRGLQLSLQDPKADKANLYGRMFDLVSSTGDFEAAEGILREAILRLPDRPSLRIMLASALLEQERWEDALDEALHPALRSRPDAVSLALSAAAQVSDRSSATLEALGVGIEDRVNLTLGARLDLAVVYAHAGHQARAEALFTSIPESPENLAPIAESRLLLGHYEEARRLAEQNIAIHQAPSTGDWLLLGDARIKMGLTAEAQEAYAKALSDVRHTIRHAVPPRVSQASP